MSEKAHAKRTFTDLPEGTVTFLFTDIEGSTNLLKQLGADRYGQVLADQRRILRTAFDQYNGREIDTQGDSFFVSFPRATQAVSATVVIQRALAQHQWPEVVEVRVRMGLHTGEPLTADEGYVGMDVHRAARIAHVGHGGQVLLSETTTPLVIDELPEGVELLDLGRHKLKDLHRPEHIHQLVIQDLPSEFPPLKSLELLPPQISLDAGEIELPAFLKEAVEPAPHPVFVGRERELARLGAYLDQASSGRGSLVFITGGPGRGKTALMQAFASQQMETHPDLIVASGKCNAYTGKGDPYHPFREVLGDLSGDLESKWSAGTISSDHAKRLWQVLPFTAQAIVDHGPDLVEVFIPGKGLVSRASLAVPEQRGLLQALRSTSERGRASPGELEQKALFEQYLDVLCQLASRRPLLVMLDDLQWADSASLNLLFHLGRELSGGRIILLCAYRPEEVSLGRDGARHPLEEILLEFKRVYGEVWIDLSKESEDEGRSFVDEFLNSELNRFSQDFRQALFAHTAGHPLFTVELLREMQARGDLVQDGHGYWMEGQALNWDLLPARVEGVIAARIGRLEAELREILTIASVEGEDFTAQVIARVQQASERGLVHQLSGELAKVHRLVGERGILQVAEQQLYLYRFRHSLFQQHLYNGLGEIERKLLHKDVGLVLENLYGDQHEQVAGQLAWHFSQAGEVGKAIQYSLLAGDRAREIYAYQEAIAFYQLAIADLKEKGDDQRAARTLMKLGLSYHSIFDFQRSREAYDEAFTFRQRAGTTPPAGLEPASHPYRIRTPEPVTLDPTKAGEDHSSIYIDNIFSGLVELGAGGEILPYIARSWEISADGCQYRFHLRDDLTWSDGKPVSAADFEYALKRILDPATDSRKSDLLYDVKGAQAYHSGESSDPDLVGIRAIDAFTLEVELERPASYFLHLLTRIYPVPRHVVEAFGPAWTTPGNLVSNGPFLLDSYLPGESITLVRNPAYHGRFPGNLEVVESKLNLPGPDALQLYELDGVDFVGLSRDIYSARHSYIDEYVSVNFPDTSFVSFNSSRAPLDDLKVRRALVLAVDRDRLAGEVSAGYHHPASGGFVPPGLPGHSPGIALPYDPDRARHLLAQAGYPDGRGFPKFQLGVGSGHKNLAEYLVVQWRHNLNVEVGLVVAEIKKFIEEYIELYHLSNLIVSGWVADYPDPDNFLRVGVQAYNPYWRNESYDRLLDRAQRSTDQEERMCLYQAADKILIEEVAFMPINYLRGHGLVKPWMEVPPGWRGNSWKDVIIEPH